MKAGGLTDLVLSFHGEFHQQLLGVGADEDKWRSGLLAGIRELQEEIEEQFSIIFTQNYHGWIGPSESIWIMNHSGVLLFMRRHQAKSPPTRA